MKQLKKRRQFAGMAAVLALCGVLTSTRAQAIPLVGDQTIVLLTSAGVLSGAGITLSPVAPALAGLDLAGRLEALFPITGGDVTGLTGTIEHSGGLSLASGPNTLALENLVIDLSALTVTGDVTVNGGAPGSASLFDVAQCTALVGTGLECIDGDGSILLDGWKLSVTAAAADTLSELFGLPNLTGAQFGVARIDIRPIPEPGTALLLGGGLVAAVVAGRRRSS